MRIADYRIPKTVFYGELDAGHRTLGGQLTRCKDLLEATLKSFGVPHNTWETTAIDRTLWRSTCHSGLRDYEEKRCDALRDKRVRRKVIQPSPNIDTFVSHVCGLLCASRIGLHSHNRTDANTNTEVKIRRTDGSLHTYSMYSDHVLSSGKMPTTVAVEADFPHVLLRCDYLLVDSQDYTFQLLLACKNMLK